MTMNYFNKYAASKIFLTVLLIVSTIFILKPLIYDYYPDFSSYYYNTLAFSHGENPYLTAEKALGPFLYPPSALILFYPLTFVSFFVAEKIFTTISIISLLLSLVLLLDIAKIKLNSSLGILLIVLTFNFFPAKFTLGMGQINNVVLLITMLFVFFYLKKRKSLAGIFLAVASALKITPAILIVFVIIRRDWKTLRATVTTIIAIALITYFLVNQTVIYYFFKVTLPGLLSASPSDYYNQSITGFLIRGFENVQLRNLVRTVTTVILASLSFYLVWKNKKRNTNSVLLSISIIITLALIVSGVSWQHHFVLALIPLFLTFVFLKSTSLNIKYFLVLTASYFLIALNLKNPSVVPVIFQSHVFYGALLLYSLNTYLLFKSARA